MHFRKLYSKQHSKLYKKGYTKQEQPAEIMTMTQVTFTSITTDYK
jgi:hypothetical protein